MHEEPGLGLHRFAVLTAAATFALLFVGGLVTSTGSGLAVPDWPLAFGQFFPEMVGGVLFEHGHRLVASAVGFLTLVLAGWTVLREPRPAVRLLGLAALATVILQGVLGGITVLYKLPLAVSVTHACLAQAFFGLTLTLSVVTAPSWTSGRTVGVDTARPSLALLAAGTVALVFSQVLLGALTRHMKAGLAIPDFPLAFGRLIPPLVTPHITVHFAHRVGALVVAVGVGWLLVRVQRRHADVPALRRPARLAAALVVLQILLGGLTVWTARAVVPTTTHLVVGAAIFGSCLVLALRAHRLLPRARRLPAAARGPARAFA
jgi:cytochrome c oxidase assembly protein subunit 15